MQRSLAVIGQALMELLEGRVECECTGSRADMVRTNKHGGTSEGLGGVAKVGDGICGHDGEERMDQLPDDVGGAVCEEAEDEGWQ